MSRGKKLLLVACVAVAALLVKGSWDITKNDYFTLAGRTYFIAFSAAVFGISVLWFLGERLGNLIRVAATATVLAAGFGAGAVGLLNIPFWEDPPAPTVASSLLTTHPAESSFTHRVTLDPRKCVLEGNLPNKHDVSTVISPDQSHCLAIVDLQVASLHVVADGNPDAPPLGTETPLDTYVVNLARQGKGTPGRVEFFLYYPTHLDLVQWVPTGYDRGEVVVQRQTRCG